MQNLPLLAALILLGMALNLPDAEGQGRRKRIKQRFRASAMLGFNLSQIDGDNYNGFDKFNPQFGLVGTAIINRRSEIGVELLYQGKGSRTETNPRSQVAEKDRKIDFTYVEVPIYYRYNTDESFPCTFLEIGGAFGRLVDAQITEPEVVEDNFTAKGLEPDLNSTEISTMLGVGYQFTEHVGMKFRYSFSLTRAYNADEAEEGTNNVTSGGGRGLQQLRNYYISLAGFYRF